MHEKEPTANRRESALRARRIGFAYPHSRSSCPSQIKDLLGYDTTARPFIGTVRANPVGAPAPPIVELPLDLMS